MEQEKKAKVESGSATEVTQAPARGETLEVAQNSDKSGTKARVNPLLGVTAVAVSKDDGTTDTYEVGVTHTVTKELLNLKDTSGESYFVEENNN